MTPVHLKDEHPAAEERDYRSVSQICRMMIRTHLHGRHHRIKFAAVAVGKTAASDYILMVGVVRNQMSAPPPKELMEAAQWI